VQEKTVNGGDVTCGNRICLSPEIRMWRALTCWAL